MQSNKLLLGIDIGTQAVKGVVVNLEGQIVSQASLERGPSHPHPGWVVMNPEQDVWDAVVQVIKKLLTKTDVSSDRIAVIGVSGLVPCMCAIDDDGSPVGEMILYSDNRALEQLNWVEKTAGLRLTAEAVIPKLIWIRDKEPERFSRIRTVFSAHNYAVFRLTGEKSIDYDTASILGGIFDVQKKSWAADIIQRLNLPLPLFPPPKPATSVIGYVTQTAALQTNLPEGIPVIAGSGDTFPTMIGCGVVDPGDAMVSFGTTGLLTLTQKALVDSAGGPHFDDGSGEASVAWVANVLSTGQLIRWYFEQFPHADIKTGGRLGGSIYEFLDARAGRLPPGAEGLLVLPHWLGRRTPTPDPHLRGAMIGFTPSHTSVHIYRAILEAFAYNLRQTYTLTRSNIRRVVATAGGARSKLWRQIVSDILTTEIEYYPASSGSLGIAFLAGYAVGLVHNFEDIKYGWLYEPQISIPDPKATPVYDRYFDVYCRFEEQMSASFMQLACITE